MEARELQEIHEKVNEHKKGNGAEIKIGLFMALFAATLGIAEIASKKAEAEYLVSNNEKASAFQWYQSKSIKQNIASGQRDLLGALIESGAIASEQAGVVKETMKKIDSSISRYEKEKNEILGKKDHKASESESEQKETKQAGAGGNEVKSAVYWEEKGHKLHKTANTFAFASLFLQLCLVMGAISLMLHEKRIRLALLSIFALCGGAGTVFTIMAYLQFFAIK